MQPSRSLIRPTSKSSAREVDSSNSWFAVFPVILTTSSLVTVFPWKGIPTVVTGPGSDALTIPIGVLNEVDTSPSSTQPMVRPSRLIGIPTVSCFTTSLVPSIVGPLPSATRKGVVLPRARPDFCTAYAPRPVAIPPITRSGTHLEIIVGKTSDCKDATQPRIQIDNMIPTNAARRFQRRLTSALPAPELVSVRRTRPRKNSPKTESNRVAEDDCIPRGPRINQTRARSADRPPNIPAIRLNTSDIPESRPISINLFSSECLAHQRQSPDEQSASLCQFVASLVAVGDKTHIQQTLQMIVDRGRFEAGGCFEVGECLPCRVQHLNHLEPVSVGHGF